MADVCLRVTLIKLDHSSYSPVQKTLEKYNGIGLQEGESCKEKNLTCKTSVPRARDIKEATFFLFYFLAFPTWEFVISLTNAELWEGQSDRWKQPAAGITLHLCSKGEESNARKKLHGHK